MARRWLLELCLSPKSGSGSSVTCSDAAGRRIEFTVVAEERSAAAAGVFCACAHLHLYCILLLLLVTTTHISNTCRPSARVAAPSAFLFPLFVAGPFFLRPCCCCFVRACPTSSSRLDPASSLLRQQPKTHRPDPPARGSSHLSVFLPPPLRPSRPDS